MNSNLRHVIDRMVEDSIRRILPGVMNEVLVATIAHGAASSIMEDRSARPRPRKAPKRRKPVREQRSRAASKPQPLKRRRSDLNEMLTVDESAGSEFYGDRGTFLGQQADEDDVELDEDRDAGPAIRRIQSLPPELRGLAEDIDMSDDDGEMWGSEHDSAMMSQPQAGEIRNINEAAKHAGVDFSRMKAVIGATSPVKKIDRDDLRANAQFEQARLKRMREQLNGGKPVE